MSDKRSVATDALDTLGTAPLDDTAKRDAIHLAVEPAIAGVDLRSGGHVEVRDGAAWPVVTGRGIGIVDPFLPGFVERGQRFWLVLYPRTIQSLRHVWSHPAFADEPVVGVAAPASAGSEGRAPGSISTSKADSERWLREFCDRGNVPSYEGVMEAIADGSDLEYGLAIQGDASGEISEEFWLHVEIVLGRKLDHHPTYFSCSC